MAIIPYSINNFDVVSLEIVLQSSTNLAIIDILPFFFLITLEFQVPHIYKLIHEFIILFTPLLLLIIYYKHALVC